MSAGIGFLWRSWLLWQLLVLPVRVAILTILLVALLGTILVQAALSVIHRESWVGRRPVPFLRLFFNEGRTRGGFDSRFVLLHPTMNLERFWQIVIQHHPFVTTAERVLVSNRDQVAIPYLGHFDRNERVDSQLLDDPPSDYVLIPATLAGRARGLFAVLITNQGGFGFGIQSGDKLVFRDARVARPAESDVVLCEDTTVRQVESGDPMKFLGVLVGAVRSDGTVSPLRVGRDEG